MYHQNMMGVAMKTDENVPDTTPKSMMSAKSKIEPSPKAKSARIAKRVVMDVIAVRDRQEQSGRLPFQVYQTAYLLPHAVL